MYRSNGDKVTEGVEEARAEVVKAEQAYSRGGSCAAVNKANARLADAHAAWREYYGGVVDPH